MRLFRLQGISFALAAVLALGFLVVAQPNASYAQETTGGLQGTVKDATGAVVPNAKVTLTGTSLIGSKQLVTDTSGYYRFANLPPGAYTVVVAAEGFKTYIRQGLGIEAGHLPTVDLTLQVGAAATTVEVTESGPVIDTTTTQNMTNLSSQTLQNAPTGITYQSVIQYAPMARNEPLAGMSLNGQATSGTGGAMPGSSGNGLSFGYSIGGAADSESSYLVEGQDTENVSGGASSANVPMDFIQEVQMTTSGVPAEYGGALGGVVNVIMKKGANDFHGSIFSTYESSGTDANPVNEYLRYDPTQTGNQSTGQDPGIQEYQAMKDHFRTAQPGILVGGPIDKNRLWFVAGFDPLINSRGRSVNFSGSALSSNASAGEQYFTQDRQTYFGYGRLDAALTSKIRVFGSWLYQFARETGDNLPIGDPEQPESGYLNASINTPLAAFSHGLGYSSPNATYNVGADLTVTQHLVATTRYGYFFENYHDFGWPTSTPNLVWNTDAVGACENVNGGVPGGTGAADQPTNCSDPTSASYTPGYALPANLQLPAGATTTPYDSSYTLFNASKHFQFNQDFAFYKGGWWGTHNFKFGYQLNHLENIIDQNGNVPEVFMNVGPGLNHNNFTLNGGNNCATLAGFYGSCTGQYGYVTIQDFATILTTPASDWNHALYVQDSWTVGKGVTLDVGLRIEKESLPAPGGVKVSSINFPWSDKIEPRVGAAWDPSGKGKMKLFGSYDVVNDVMKLLLAQTSWGAQAYEDCTYPLGPDGTPTNFSNSDIDAVYKNGRACPTAAPNVGANFGTGSVPASLVDSVSGVSLIENANERPWEPVAPNVKPYRQHEYVIGWDYQLSQRWAFEARYDRRRLDHVIEDAALSDKVWGEMYSVVNPGEGVDSTLDGYASFLASLGQAFGIQGAGYAFSDTADWGPGADFGTCPSCPAMPKAIRNYDGLELRLTMAPTRNWAGMVSYTYSSLWGNYPGLTTTDQTDGGTTGRDSPDTTRAFDEPFYYFGANGKSTAGPLPTDRPNVVKGFVTYTLPWWKRQATTFGLFQQLLQGSPMSSYLDLTASEPGEPYEATYIYGRGNWVNMTTDPTTGAITLGTPYARRTPWFMQSDLNVKHDIKVGDHQNVSFEATALNVLNERSTTAYWQGMNSLYFATPIYPGTYGTYPSTSKYAGQPVPINLADGAALYQTLESGYNVQQWINGNNIPTVPPVVASSEYGKPYLEQLGRSIRLGINFTF